ncbi:MAG: IclR family transcriptional regulator [Anaerolineaceae bacterium]|nr:IclR family transcriptional regulator [Anaerolineaceae bacterium]
MQAINRIVSILDCFSQAHPQLGVREIARKIGLPASTTGRILVDMKASGLLGQNSDNQMYLLGGRLLSWAGVYTATLDVRIIAMPSMHKLHQSTDETISLYILEGNERLCVERMESTHNVRIVARIGRHLPLYAGSAGRVFLAHLSEDRRDQILDETEFILLTPNTIPNRKKLLEEVSKTRKKGFSVSNGEWLQEASGIAAPIFDQSREIAAAISISGPTQRFTPENIKIYSEKLLNAAGEISANMGYRY